jgi:Holliday junction resolvase
MTRNKINSKSKGNRAELEIAKILTERFGTPFARVGVSSGARVKNTKLPDNALCVMSGDIIVPEHFAFGTIEVKSRQSAVNYRSKNKALDAIIDQAEADAKRTFKPPLICIKANRAGWDVLVPIRAFAGLLFDCDYFTRYKDYFVYRLETLLAFDNWLFWWEIIESERLTTDESERNM